MEASPLSEVRWRHIQKLGIEQTQTARRGQSTIRKKITQLSDAALADSNYGDSPDDIDWPLQILDPWDAAMKESIIQDFMTYLKCIQPNVSAFSVALQRLPRRIK